MLLIGAECEQFTFQFGGFVGIGRSKRRILGGRHLTRDTVHASGTDMHDALYLSLSLACLEQNARAFHVRPAIQFCRDAGMIETSREVVNRGCAIDHLLDWRCIGDISWNDRYCVSKLLARFFFVTYEYTYRLPLFDKFGHQGAAQKASCACYYCGHNGFLVPE